MHVIWEAELLPCLGVRLPWLEWCKGVGAMRRRWAPPIQLWRPSSLCLASRGCHLSGNWKGSEEKRKRVWKNCECYQVSFQPFNSLLSNIPKSNIFYLILITFPLRNIFLFFPQMLSKMLLFRQVSGLTCRKGSAQEWCWGATQHVRPRPRAAEGSPAAQAGLDRAAAAPPGHTSTSRAGSSGSASTNTATTKGSPCL